MEDKITVIIPIYNVEKYLRRCILSVIGQTYENLEIFLIDDGSTDNSGTICDEYAQKDGRITVIHKENAGQAVARNIALDRASGDWIAFLDSDDWIEPDMYMTLLRVAMEADADIATCGIKKHFDSGEYLSSSEDTGRVEVLSAYDAIADLLHQKRIRFEVWNKLWKRELLADVRFKENQLCEEVYFDRQAFLRAERIVFVDKSLHNYVVGRPGSTASSFKIKRMSVFGELEDFANDLLARNLDDLADIIKCISTRFSVNFYVEAAKSNVSEEIKSALQKQFNRYYREIRKSVFLTKKEKVMFFVFSKSPKLFFRLFMIKNGKKK
ncbi:MAG: glycosyltransferase [Clostridia bacterium]|nr:glycosyltransferase [Clostridia bacterium]